MLRDQTNLRRQGMLRPEEVEAMVGLYELGWGTKRIAEEFGCSRNTVKRYVATAGWVPYGSPLARFEREGGFQRVQEGHRSASCGI